MTQYRTLTLHCGTIRHRREGDYNILVHQGKPAFMRNGYIAIPAGDYKFDGLYVVCEQSIRAPMNVKRVPIEDYLREIATHEIDKMLNSEEA